MKCACASYIVLSLVSFQCEIVDVVRLYASAGISIYNMYSVVLIYVCSAYLSFKTEEKTPNICSTLMVSFDLSATCFPLSSTLAIITSTVQHTFRGVWLLYLALNRCPIMRIYYVFLYSISIQLRTIEEIFHEIRGDFSSDTIFLYNQRQIHINIHHFIIIIIGTIIIKITAHTLSKENFCLRISS